MNGFERKNLLEYSEQLMKILEKKLSERMERELEKTTAETKLIEHSLSDIKSKISDIEKRIYEISKGIEKERFLEERIKKLENEIKSIENFMMNLEKKVKKYFEDIKKDFSAVFTMKTELEKSIREFTLLKDDLIRFKNTVLKENQIKVESSVKETMQKMMELEKKFLEIEREFRLLLSREPVVIE